MQIETFKIVMSFDFGTKRIGVAIGQTITKSARPLTTINAKEGVPDWNTVTPLIKKWRPDAFVIGVPLNMDGTEQPITQLARMFANSLKEQYNLPVFEMDERLTTKDARERIFSEGGYKALQEGQVDQVAAQLILQNWFAENIK
jgi:putative Holliday junction resolvase